jgi:hypothetical protein
MKATSKAKANKVLMILIIGLIFKFRTTLGLEPNTPIPNLGQLL